MKNKALAQLRSGESLYGKNGAFAPLMKKFLEFSKNLSIPIYIMFEHLKYIHFPPNWFVILVK
ncbi:MAG: hypothetical protein ACTMH4_14080 [Sphingobacterium sp.]|nr:transposase [Sphingobacterium sp. JB170]